MSYFGNKDFALEVRRSNVTGITGFERIGHTDSTPATAGIAALHHGVATRDLDLEGLYATPATVVAASTSANDTNTAGTGARTITLYGQNGSGVEVSETITLAGQTESSASSNTYRFIDRIEVATAGSGGVNAGTIWVGRSGTFTSGVPSAGNALMSMEIGTNRSASASFQVPTGFTLYLNQVTIGLADTTKPLNVSIQEHDGTLTQETWDFHLDSGFFQHNFTGAAGIAADTLVRVDAATDTSGASASVLINGFLIAN